MEAYYLLNSKRKNVPYTWLFISKQVLTIGLILLSIVDLGMAIHESTYRTVYSVDYYTPFIKIISFVSTTEFYIINIIYFLISTFIYLII